jgi:hypothetical protein
MKFNFITDNLSLFSRILLKESLTLLYNKSYGLNRMNIVIVIYFFLLYISERRYSTLNII